MREVIRIDEKVENEKPVEFTHYQTQNGWKLRTLNPKCYDKIVWLGTCEFDGDLFAAYSQNVIVIYKGHLNSGKY